MKFFLFILVFTLLFSSCGYTDDNEFYGGDSMNAEILSSIAESIFNEDSSNISTSDEIVDYEIVDGVYYWTDNGSVYHNSKKCSHIKDTLSLHSGSREEAELNGKNKLCSLCEKHK